MTSVSAAAENDVRKTAPGHFQSILNTWLAPWFKCAAISKHGAVIKRVPCVRSEKVYAYRP